MIVEPPITPSPSVGPPSRHRPVVLTEEQRYPLRLSERSPALRDLYRVASRDRWDPETLLEWGALAEGAPPEAARAAALVWSHRTWLEYRGIRESETALIRLCLEAGRETDAKFFLTNRGTKKALAAEASWLAATRLGDFTPGAPAGCRLAGLFSDDLARRGLHAGGDPDAFLLEVLAGDAVDLRCLRAARAATVSAGFAVLLDRLIVDRRRHVEFGRITVERVRGVTGPRRTELHAGLERARRRECAGFRAPSGDGDRFDATLADAYRTAASAGLGAAPPETLQRAVRDGMDDVTRTLAEVGLAPRADEGAP